MASQDDLSTLTTFSPSPICGIERPMHLSPVVALLHKLLKLCYQHVKANLRWLLETLAQLSRALNRYRKPLGKCGFAFKESDGTKNSGARSSKPPSCIQDHDPLSPIPTEGGAALACSSAPASPPQARTRMRERTQSEPIPEAYVHDPPFDYSSFMSQMCEDFTDDHPGGTFFDNGDTYVEPVGMGSKSVQGRRRIRAVTPSQRNRYYRNIVIESKYMACRFGPLETYSLFRKRNVQAWEFFVHPEGCPYYLYVSSTGLSFLTEADLQNPDILEEVETFMNELEQRVESFDWNSIRPKNIEVVLELQGGWQYYMVDLDERVVFWIGECVIRPTPQWEFGVGHRDHYRTWLDFEYWKHLEYFPNHRDIPMKWFGEANGILSYWIVDSLSSGGDSTAPYDLETLETFVGSIHRLEDTMKEGYNHAYAVTSLARVMAIAAHVRHYNFHGLPGARLQAWKSVKGQHRIKQSWLIKYLSVLLFYVPQSYFSELERHWVDGFLQLQTWKTYCTKLEQNWRNAVLISTILLPANVSFLAAPIVVSYDVEDRDLFASPAGVTTQMSIITSIGSITSALLLLTQFRDTAKNATDLSNYIGKLSNNVPKLEVIAIMLSLPYALLMWSMATFFVSIGIVNFYDVQGWPNTGVKIVYILTWLFVSALIGLAVITGSKMDKHWNASNSIKRARVKTLNRAKMIREKMRNWIRKPCGDEVDPERAGP